MVNRETIERVLAALNAAENALSETGVEGVSSSIDKLMSPAVEGWRNGVHFPSRQAERDLEKRAFGSLPDYQRTIERTIIDPPFAATGWTIRGSFEGKPVCAPGSSHFEFSEDGLIRRYWMNFNPEDFFYRKG